MKIRKRFAKLSVASEVKEGKESRHRESSRGFGRMAVGPSIAWCARDHAPRFLVYANLKSLLANAGSFKYLLWFLPVLDHS